MVEFDPSMPIPGGPVAVVIGGVVAWFIKEKYRERELRKQAAADEEAIKKREAIAAQDARDELRRKTLEDTVAAHIKGCTEKDLARIQMQETVKHLETSFVRLEKAFDSTNNKIDQLTTHILELVDKS